MIRYLPYLLALLSCHLLYAQESSFWTKLPPNYGNFARKIMFDSLGGIYYISPTFEHNVKGKLLYSSDRGNTWKILTDVPYDTYYEVADRGGNIYAYYSADRDSAGANLFYYDKKKDVRSDRYRPGSMISDIAVDSVGRIFNGMSRSADNGKTWQKMYPPVLHGDTLYVHEHNIGPGNSLYSTFENQQYKYRIFSSFDLGKSWDSVGNMEDVIDLAFLKNQEILALTPGELFIASLSDPMNWRSITGSLGFMVQSFTTDASGAIYILCKDEYGISTDKLWRSDDKGKNWRLLSEHATRTVFTIAAASDNTVYASTDEGLLRSFNKGDSWENISPAIPDTSQSGISDFVTIPDGRLLGFSGSNIYEISEKGFITRKIARSPHYIEKVALHPNGDLFAATRQGIARSTDNGYTWLTSFLSFQSMFDDIAIDKKGVIYAKTDYGACIRSYNSGENWEEMATPTPVTSFLTTNDDGLFIGTQSERFSYHPSGVYRSTDHGDSWIPIVKRKEPFDRMILSLFTVMARNKKGQIYAYSYDYDVIRIDSAGFTSFPDSRSLGTITLDSSDLLYAGIRYPNNKHGIARSYDGIDWVYDTVHHASVFHLNYDGYMHVSGGYQFANLRNTTPLSMPPVVLTSYQGCGEYSVGFIADTLSNVRLVDSLSDNVRIVALDTITGQRSIRVNIGLINQSKKGKFFLTSTNSKGLSTTFSDIISIPARKPNIHVLSDTIFTDTYLKYQWYLNEMPIEGATFQWYKIPAKDYGKYSVRILDTNWCPAISDNFEWIKSDVTHEIKLAINPDISPNAVKAGSVITIRVEPSQDFSVEYYSLLGEKMGEMETVSKYSDRVILQIPALTQGTYLLRITNNSHSYVKSIIVSE